MAIARHPLIELLLWRVEGGIVDLLGMLLQVWAGLKLVARAQWRDKRLSPAAKPLLEKRRGCALLCCR